MADDNLLNQDEIERLLQQAQSSASQPKKAEPAPPAAAPAGASSAEDTPLGQDEIERLLASAKGSAPSPKPAAPATAAKAAAATAAPPVAAAAPEEGCIPQSDIDFLLGQAEAALRSIEERADGDLPTGAKQFSLEEFAGAAPTVENTTIDLIRDVELDLKIELGRTQMYLEDVLRLRKGSVVPLDKLAGDPVDIFVNGRLIARGEVLVLNDNFCVRVAELVEGVCAAG